MTAPGPPWRRTREGVVVACRLTPRAGATRSTASPSLPTERLVLAARVRSAPQGGEANRRCARCWRIGSAPRPRRRESYRLEEPGKQVAVSGDPEP